MFFGAPTLLQEETLLKREAASRHGYGRGCTVVLTDRRLIFKTLFREDWFPLAHIKSVSRTGFILRVDFDDGHTETISTLSADQWQAGIEQARVNAPQLEYDPAGIRPAFDISGTTIIIFAAGSLIAFLAACCMVAATVLYFS